MAAQPVHIDISQEINGWANAQIGRDVRKYNVSALAKLQDQTNTAVDYVVEKGEAIDQAAKDVQTVRQEAQGAVDHANDITAEYKQYADDKLAATVSADGPDRIGGRGHLGGELGGGRYRGSARRGRRQQPILGREVPGERWTGFQRSGSGCAVCQYRGTGIFGGSGLHGVIHEDRRRSGFYCHR